MIEITPDQGFSLLQTYCQRRTALRVTGSIRGDFADSNATVVDTAQKDAEVCLRLFEEPEGLNWLCKISLAGATYWFDHFGASQNSPEPAFASPVSLLRIKHTDGSELLLGEEPFKYQ